MLGELKNNITRRNRDELQERYKNKIIKFACILAFLLLLFPFYNLMSNLLRLYPVIDSSTSDLEVHVVDVGEALCTLVKFPTGETLVYDTGLSDSWDKVSVYIEKVLKPKDNIIDYLVLSHKDSDHSGNAYNIYETFKPRSLYLPDVREEIDLGYLDSTSSYYNFYEAVLYDDTSNIYYNKAGLELNIGETKLNWLAPNRDFYTNSNDYSAVVLLTLGNFEILFAGDSGHNTGVDDAINIEREFISYADANNINLDIDVLIAGHHGSRYSTSLELLNKTTPESIIISVGDNNYGHPHDDVYTNILEYDLTHNTNLYDNTLTTKEMGNIIVVADLDGEYTTQYIDNISKFLFMPFYIVEVVLIVPTLYCLLDSIIIYKKILDSYKKKKSSEKKNTSEN